MPAANKWQWVEKNPGLPNNWSKMRDCIVVQRPVGTIDAAGGTPADYEDYIVGPDGLGVYAQISEPSSDEVVIAMAKNVKLTHTIIVRYDPRITEDMRLRFYFNGNMRYANIHKVTDVEFRHIWMKIQAVEAVYNAGAYQ
jgi:SPP1 family predicted phage head-tail adaptor